MLTNQTKVEIISNITSTVTANKYAARQVDLQGSFAPALYYSTALKTDINAISSTIADSCMSRIFSLVTDQYSSKFEAFSASIIESGIDSVDIASSRFSSQVSTFNTNKAKGVDPLQGSKQASYDNARAIRDQYLAARMVYSLYCADKANISDIESFNTLWAPLIQSLTGARISTIFSPIISTVWSKQSSYDGSKLASIVDMSKNRHMFKSGTNFTFSQAIEVLPLNTVTVKFYLDASTKPAYTTTITPDTLGNAFISATQANFALGSAKSIRVTVQQNLPTGIISSFAATSGLEYLNAIPEVLFDEMVIAVVASAPKLSATKQATIIDLID